MLPANASKWTSCLKLKQEGNTGGKKTLSLLDLGCNSGDLSLKLYERLAAAAPADYTQTVLFS